MYLSEGFAALSLEVEHQHFYNHSILLTFSYFLVLNKMLPLEDGAKVGMGMTRCRYGHTLDSGVALSCRDALLFALGDEK